MSLYQIMSYIPDSGKKKGPLHTIGLRTSMISATVGN